jgi:hypothetical protein
MASSGMFRRVAFVRIDDSKELSASFIGVKRIGELGTTLPVTSNQRTLRPNRARLQIRKININVCLQYIYVCEAYY